MYRSLAVLYHNDQPAVRYRYFDVGGAYWSVQNNVLDCPAETDWIFGGQWNLTVTDNWYSNPSTGLMASHSTLARNTRVMNGSWPPVAEQIMSGAGVRKGMAHPDYRPGTCCRCLRS